MPRITWGKPEHRAFEAGLDRGVLQVEGGEPVSWSGLVAIKENASGGGVTPFYQDGFRRHNYVENKEFEATLDALSYPDEFGACEGIVSDAAAVGLILDQQPPKTFNLAYRTGIGGGLSSRPDDYKLHLVYNCTVGPAPRAYNTTSTAVELVTYSWTIVTVPRFDLTGAYPSAHFMVDSTIANPAALSDLEDVLYGTEETEPKFPTPPELRTILGG